MKERHTDRYNSYAKVVLDGTPGYMRDISAEGFKYVTPLPIGVREGEVEIIQIIPQDGALSGFELEGEIRWVKNDQEGFQICGIRVRAFYSPGGEKTYRKMEELFSL